VATTAIPLLIDALVLQARAALPRVQVHDGFGITAEKGELYLMVGVEDPNSDRDSFGGEAEQEWAHANYTARDEQGRIMCAALAWNGDADPKAARDSAFGVVASIEALCRANPSLGVPQLLWTSFGGRIRLSQDQATEGAVALVLFDINYRARI
jgi:hypothetical protein